MHKITDQSRCFAFILLSAYLLTTPTLIMAMDGEEPQGDKNKQRFTMADMRAKRDTKRAAFLMVQAENERIKSEQGGGKPREKSGRRATFTAAALEKGQPRGKLKSKTERK